MKINFYNFKVNIVTKEKKIETLLHLDFHYFVKDFIEKEDLKIEVHLKDSLSNIIPEGLVANKQSINSMTYDSGNIRYNDYYGDVISIFDYNKQTCEVYSKCIQRAHEVTYLIILSRQGKWSDMKGLHKIHAMGICSNKKNLLLMLPMKGGKTTTFIKFLEDDRFGIISDDSPIINRKGEVQPFPIRLGVEDVERYQDYLSQIPNEFKSELQRKQYGKKILVDLMFYKKRVRIAEKNILVQGLRKNSTEVTIKKIGKIKMFLFLLKNMVVGIGLPMIIEYFIESTIQDNILNLKIFLKRMKASFSLLHKSECYLAYLGTDIEKNTLHLKRLLDHERF